MNLKQVARRELSRITDEELNPGWYKDPKLLERRDKLLILLGTPNEQRNPGESREAYRERMANLYFMTHPGLEEQVITMIKARKPKKRIQSELGIPMRIVQFLCNKYQSKK